MADWKSNPVITAVISGGLIFTGTLAACFTYFIPTYLKESQNETSEIKKQLKVSNDKNIKLESKIDEYNKTVSENVLKETYNLSLQIRELKSELEISKLELANANKKYDEAEKGKNDIKNKFFHYTLMNGFMAGSPYPIGYSKIKIGSSISDFNQAYSKPEINSDSDEGYLSIKPSSGVIGEISYKFSKKTQTVESISFTRRVGLSLDIDDFRMLNDLDLASLLTDVIGKPFTCDEKPKYKYWELSDGSGNIFSLGTPFHYIILANGLSPAIWPHDCPPNHMQTSSENFFPHVFPEGTPQ